MADDDTVTITVQAREDSGWDVSIAVHVGPPRRGIDVELCRICRVNGRPALGRGYVCKGCRPELVKERHALRKALRWSREFEAAIVCSVLEAANE